MTHTITVSSATQGDYPVIVAVREEGASAEARGRLVEAARALFAAADAVAGGKR